ncbi:MAG: membrane or secreted protein [Pirellulaceae bacterium]
MLRRLTLVAMALATTVSAGCANGRFYNPFRPNDVQAQRIRATVHDPYPDQDKGPPVDDARPRDYQRQSPEPVRNRFYSDSGLGR